MSFSDPLGFFVADSLPSWVQPPDVSYGAFGYRSGYHTPYMSQSLLSDGVLYAAYSLYAPGWFEQPFVVASSVLDFHTTTVNGNPEAWPNNSYYYTFDIDETWNTINNDNRMVGCNFIIPFNCSGIGEPMDVVIVSPWEVSSEYYNANCLGVGLEFATFIPYEVGPVISDEVLFSSDFANRSQSTNCVEIHCSMQKWSGSGASRLFWIEGDSGFRDFRIHGNIPLGRLCYVNGGWISYSWGSPSYIYRDVWTMVPREEEDRWAYSNIFSQHLTNKSINLSSTDSHASWYSYSGYKQVSAQKWLEEPWTAKSYGSGINNAYGSVGMRDDWMGYSKNTYSMGRGFKDVHGTFGWDILRKRVFDDRDEYWIFNKDTDLEELFYVDNRFLYREGDIRIFDCTPIDNATGGFFVTTYILGNEEFSEEFVWISLSQSLLSSVGQIQSRVIDSTSTGPNTPTFIKNKFSTVTTYDDGFIFGSLLNGAFASYGVVAGYYDPPPMTQFWDMRAYIGVKDWQDDNLLSSIISGDNCAISLYNGTVQVVVRVYKVIGGQTFYRSEWAWWDVAKLPFRPFDLGWLRGTFSIEGQQPQLYYSKSSPIGWGDDWVSLGEPDGYGIGSNSSWDVSTDNTPVWTRASHQLSSSYAVLGGGDTVEFAKGRISEYWSGEELVSLDLSEHQRTQFSFGETHQWTTGLSQRIVDDRGQVFSLSGALSEGDHTWTQYDLDNDASFGQWVWTPDEQYMGWSDLVTSSGLYTATTDTSTKIFSVVVGLVYANPAGIPIELYGYVPLAECPGRWKFWLNNQRFYFSWYTSSGWSQASCFAESMGTYLSPQYDNEIAWLRVLFYPTLVSGVGYMQHVQFLFQKMYSSLNYYATTPAPSARMYSSQPSDQPYTTYTGARGPVDYSSTSAIYRFGVVDGDVCPLPVHGGYVIGQPTFDDFDGRTYTLPQKLYSGAVFNWLSIDRQNVLRWPDGAINPTSMVSLLDGKTWYRNAADPVSFVVTGSTYQR